MLSDVNYWCRHEYVQMNMSCPYLRLLPVIITRPSQTQPSQKVCQLFQGSAAIVKPNGCCGAQQQCCCLDTRIACPPNEDVPCICTLLPFCVVCANWGMKFKCCGKVKDVIGSSAKAPAAAMAKRGVQQASNDAIGESERTALKGVDPTTHSSS